MDNDLLKKARLLLGISIVLGVITTIAIAVLLLSAGWVLVDSRLRVQNIEETRFTAADGKRLRELVEQSMRLAEENSAILAERQPIIYGTADTTKKNQKMILDNQRKMEEIIEAIKRLEPKHDK